MRPVSLLGPLEYLYYQFPVRGKVLSPRQQQLYAKIPDGECLEAEKGENRDVLWGLVKSGVLKAAVLAMRGKGGELRPVKQDDIYFWILQQMLNPGAPLQPTEAFYKVKEFGIDLES